MLSHSPDVAETLDDDRVGLMLSGHTHGGQVRLPLIGSLSFHPNTVRNMPAGW